MTLLNDLEFIWFSVFAVLLTGYACLDGFDLGVGMLSTLVRKDEDKRIVMNSIGPVWDGNAVWLVTTGGAMFAGFPIVYATVCTAFYIPLMLLLTGLIFRAVAIEFRSKKAMKWWRTIWDATFSFASFVIAIILGFIMGNLIRGIPLDQYGEYSGDHLDLFNPYAFLVGIFVVALFCMHGSIYLVMKTEKELHDKLRAWINPSIIFFIMMYAITTVATLIYMPHMSVAIKERPYCFLIAIVNMLAIANIPRQIYHGNDGRAFIFSCLNIICLMVLYGLGTFPNIVRAINAPDELSLTIYNSSSSQLTLMILLVIAVIGMPLVISYTIGVYYIFRGKVKLESTSY